MNAASPTLMQDIVYAGVPLERHHRLLGWLIRWLSRPPKPATRPAVVPRDDHAVRMLEAEFRTLPAESRDEVRAQLMQVIVTFERTKDIAPLVDFVQSVLITAKLNANPRYRAALAAADAESWDQPGVSAEEMIKAANERRQAAQGRRPL